MAKAKAAATSETLVAQGTADLAGDVSGATGEGEGSTGDAGGAAGAGEGQTGDTGGAAGAGEGLTGDVSGAAGAGEGQTGDAGTHGLFMPDEIRVRSVSQHGRWRAGTKFGSRFEAYKVGDFTEEQLAAICSDEQLIVEIGKICSGDELIAEITQK